MRMLNQQEMAAVAGGGENNCSAGESSGNNIGGVTDSGGLGQDLINIYEGAVAATSHVIERVADALSD